MAIRQFVVYEAACDRCGEAYPHKGENDEPAGALADAIDDGWPPVQDADGEGLLCPGCAGPPGLGSETGDEMGDQACEEAAHAR